MVVTEPSMGLVWGIMLLMFLMILLAIAGLVFWVWMLVDCAKRTMKESDKVVWIIVLALTSYLGAIIYYFAVKRASKK